MRALSLRQTCVILNWVVGLFLVLVSASSWATDWQYLQEGLAYKTLMIGTGENEIDLHVLKVNPRYFILKPVLANGRRSVRVMAEASGAAAVINANFFDKEGKTLGAVVINGHEEKSKRPISWWGIFCVNKKQKVEIVASADYYVGLCAEAVQAGPRLVVKGKMPKLKDETSRKSAVGINSKGQVLLVASAQAISIKELAAIFMKPEANGGLDCADALNLDGGSSSQFFVKSGAFTLAVPAFSPVPVGLGVYKR